MSHFIKQLISAFNICLAYLGIGILIAIAGFIEVQLAPAGGGPLILSPSQIALALWGLPWVFILNPYSLEAVFPQTLFGNILGIISLGILNLPIIFVVAFFHKELGKFLKSPIPWARIREK